MNGFLPSLWCELLKIRRSKVLIGTIGAFALVPIMSALFVVVLRNPDLAKANAAFQAKAAFMGFLMDWPSFLNIIAQAIGVGGIIIFGFAASWAFGREYSDGTAKDLFVLPVPRSTIVIAKTVAVVLWSILLSVFVYGFSLVVGALLQLPGWSLQGFLDSSLVIAVTALLAILLFPPVAFVASVGKGYLAPLGFVVLSVVLAQIVGALGFGSHFPWAVPAIFSKVGGTGAILDSLSYLLVVLTGIVGLVATVLWWNHADQTG
jgi:ABC-2 type transport system permease protein